MRGLGGWAILVRTVDKACLKAHEREQGGGQRNARNGGCLILLFSLFVSGELLLLSLLLFALRRKGPVMLWVALSPF